MLGDSRRQRPQQGLRRAMPTAAAIAGRDTDISAVASARTHLAGQCAYKRQAHPLPETKAAEYLALGVLDGGMNRVRRRTWRQMRTSRRQLTSGRAEFANLIHGLVLSPWSFRQRGELVRRRSSSKKFTRNVAFTVACSPLGNVEGTSATMVLPSGEMS